MKKYILIICFSFITFFLGKGCFALELYESDLLSDTYLKHYYQLEDATDYKNVYNGNATGVSYTSGQFNNAGLFSVASTSRIQLGTASEPDWGRNTDTSISMWFKVSDTGVTQTFFGNYRQGYVGYINIYLEQSLDKIVCYAVASTNQDAYSISSTFTYNEWHHLVCTSKYSNGEQKMYLDGELQTASPDPSTGVATAISQASNQYSFIGAKALTQNQDTFEQYTSGQIDDLAIFNRLLTTDEIEELSLTEPPIPDLTIDMASTPDDADLNLIFDTETASSSNPIATKLFGHCGEEDNTIIFQSGTLPFYLSTSTAWTQYKNNEFNCDYSTLPGHENELVYEITVPAQYGENTFCTAEIESWSGICDWLNEDCANPPLTATSTYNLLDNGTPCITFTLAPSGEGWNDWTSWYHPTSTNATEAHNSACTTDEWNTPDPVFDWGFATTSLGIFNITKVKCVILEAGWNIGYSFRDFIKTIAYGIITTLTNTFPFNIPLKFYSAWNSANASDLPESLNWLNLDENNNITFEFGMTEMTGAATSTFIIFGEDIAQQNTKSTLFYSRIRDLSTYFIWLAFIYWIYNFAIKISNEIKFGFGHTDKEDPEYVPLDKDGWDNSMKV